MRTHKASSIYQSNRCASFMRVSYVDTGKITPQTSIIIIIHVVFSSLPLLSYRMLLTVTLDELELNRFDHLSFHPRNAFS